MTQDKSSEDIFDDDVDMDSSNGDNEVVREVRLYKEREARLRDAQASDSASDKSDESGSWGWKTAAAAGIGIGSTALIAALLYTNYKRGDSDSARGKAEDSETDDES